MVRIFPFKTDIHPQFEVKDFIEIYKNTHLFSGHNRADFFQFVWVREGTIKLAIDFKECTLNEGEALLISSEQIFSYNLISDINVSGKIILFTDSFFNQHEDDLIVLNNLKMLNPRILNSTVRINKNYVEHTLALFEIINNQDKNPFQEKIIHGHLSGLLYEAERSISKSMKVCDNKRISRIFFDEVENNYKTHKKVSYYFNKIGISGKVLSREIKNAISKTPKEYIDYRLILEAKRLLVHSAMRVNEISYELGFDEATNFNKYFIKHTQMTPIQFRKAHFIR